MTLMYRGGSLGLKHQQTLTLSDSYAYDSESRLKIFVSNVVIKKCVLQCNNTYCVGGCKTRGPLLTGCKRHEMQHYETE